MGNQGSQGSFHNKKNDTVNFVHSSSGEQETLRPSAKKQDIKDTDVWQTFTWNYGGNVVLLTGSFFKWKQTIALEKEGQQFSVTIQLPRGIHQYKFIVDGQWRFSPDDPIEPDQHGNINNVSNTNQFKKMIDPPNKPENPNKAQITDQESNVQGVQEFAKYAPKLPPHYQSCSFLNSYQNPSEHVLPATKEDTRMEDENRKFEESLTQAEIHQLFNTSHCLPPPYHVQVDHLIRQTNKTYGAYAITQRFKNKYTTYKYFMTEQQESMV